MDFKSKLFYQWFRHPDIGFKYLIDTKILYDENNINEAIFKYDLVNLFNKYENILSISNNLTNIIGYDAINIFDYFYNKNIKTMIFCKSIIMLIAIKHNSINIINYCIYKNNFNNEFDAYNLTNYIFNYDNKTITNIFKTLFHINEYDVIEFLHQNIYYKQTMKDIFSCQKYDILPYIFKLAFSKNDYKLNSFIKKFYRRSYCKFLIHYIQSIS
jgi:hypothetical protein